MKNYHKHQHQHKHQHKHSDGGEHQHQHQEKHNHGGAEDTEEAGAAVGAEEDIAECINGWLDGIKDGIGCIA